MRFYPSWARAAGVAALLLTSSAGAQAPPACAAVTRQNVVACALARSADVAAEREGLQATEGRRAAASVFLPSNPYVSLSGGRATAYPFESRNLVWGLNLSQELEIGGQRGRRLDVATAERSAQERRVEAKARDVAADALVAYFDAVAALEEKRLADRLAAIADVLRTLTQARAEVGVSAPVEAGVARAQAVRLLQAQVDADRRVATSAATLTTALGQDPSRARVTVEGALEPLAVSEAPADALAAAAAERRADVRVAAAEREAQARRADLLRAARVPNPTLSVFYRNDWLGERTVGLGLGFPIPLPAPVGRTNAGEIAEATALGRRAGLEVERLRRSIRLEVVTAAEAVASWRRALALYDQDDLRRAEESLAAIAAELGARRIGVRDAVLFQQPLIELLLGHIEAKRQLCFASVELARAAGLPLERGVQ